MLGSRILTVTSISIHSRKASTRSNYTVSSSKFHKVAAVHTKNHFRHGLCVGQDALVWLLRVLESANAMLAFVELQTLSTHQFGNLK